MPKKRILVADDEAELVKAIEIRLNRAGYEVLIACNGQEALVKAKKERPDLIILDIVMPLKSGCDVCRELKADEATRDIPIIVFTAHYPEEEYVKIGSEDIGADDYIMKPFEIQVLLEKIKRLIEQKTRAA